MKFFHQKIIKDKLTFFLAKFLLIFICFDSSVSFASVDLESIGLDKLDNQIVNDGSKTALINQAIPNKQQDEVSDKTQEKISEKPDLKNTPTSSKIADKFFLIFCGLGHL